ncbi:MAG TPA: hypothetical protein PKK20_07540, partial [Verrucomicrobiota bacterium]|nr:hypothetical protein [Verrucomicrobiota bacterium]
MKALYALCLVLVAPVLASKADFQAGVARISITPPMPFWLTGYAARTNAAASVRTELWAKALALEDSRGGRAVLVTSDVIGLPREISDAVAERAALLDRAREPEQRLAALVRLQDRGQPDVAA